MEEKRVLALYDFASKQEYIYRTSKIKEISGASALMNGMYKKFVDILKKNKDENGNEKAINLKYDVKCDFKRSVFENDNSIDGEVLYDGGGNLMVLWKNRAKYEEANKAISVYLLKNCPGLSMIPCCIECEDDFETDRSGLYKNNAERKNSYPAFDIPAVTPFTQIDPATFLPVVQKESRPEQLSLSADRDAKRKAYSKESDFDVNEGMLAAIFIDGNSMGKKLEACKPQNNGEIGYDSYDDGVARLRSFSKQINTYFVDEPLKAIENAGYDFRKVIGAGDEITLICKAEDAFGIMCTYFDTLKGKKIILSGTEFPCTSCAGISVFHAKSPFNVAYDVAEAACEDAKKRAHDNDGNYFCFYYCHGGVTNTYDVLHKNEEAPSSGKPYSIEEIDKINGLSGHLNSAGRANVKALGTAAHNGINAYSLEVERVNAYLKGNKLKSSEEEMKMVYDIAEFFDLWFAKDEEEEKADEKNA